MRTLKFIVDKQIITADTKCDFTRLVPGTKDYLKVEFSFSPEWNGFTKVVGFWSAMGKEYSPQLLADGKSCVIPSDAARRREFKLQVLGKKGELTQITNKVTIIQNGDRL